MTGPLFLDQYRVVRQLDEGGMSKIYLARHEPSGREVVVKVLKEALANQPKAREHFRREIHILSRFSHPHAVAYLDSAPNERWAPVLVMEYLRGLDLNLLRHRVGRFPPDRVGRLLAQLCDVLQAAHDTGIVHRDLKPGNLMVLHPDTSLETVKLMDFGLAKMSAMLYIAPEEVIDWSMPSAAGTPEYISPEQVRGQEADARSDLYSVGVMLYELLAGRRPFDGADAEELMVCHRDAEPPTFAAVGLTGLPAGLEDVVRACLAKSPERRPAGALELARRYEAALGKRVLGPRRAPEGVGGPATPPPASRPLVRSGVIRHSVEATMLEAMAMLKLKGFIQDLGGVVVESVPGMIKVRLAAPGAAKPAPSLLGWLGVGGKPVSALEVPVTTTLELHMERKDPANANKLTVTILMDPGRGPATPEWRARCQKIGLDLKAYLMRR